MKSSQFFRAIVFLSLIEAVCASCKSKEDTVLDRVQSRPKPGYVRIFNLSGCEMKLVDRGLPVLTAAVEPAASSFAAIHAGQDKVSASGPCGSVPITIDVASQGAGTLVVGSDGKTATWIDGEVRVPTADANMRVVVLDSSGKLASSPDLKLTDGTHSVSFGSSKSTGLLSSGTWSCDLPGLEAPIPMSIADGRAYTLFLVRKKGIKWKGTFVDNSPVGRPTASGASST